MTGGASKAVAAGLQCEGGIERCVHVAPALAPTQGVCSWTCVAPVLCVSGRWDRQGTQADAAPEQLALDVLRTAAVVKPVGHGSQGGAEAELLPPADQLPAAHSEQPEPP